MAEMKLTAKEVMRKGTNEFLDSPLKAVDSMMVLLGCFGLAARRCRNEGTNCDEQGSKDARHGWS